MSYLLDTNVLSELRRKAPDPQVVRWFSQRSAGDFDRSEALDVAIGVAQRRARGTEGVEHRRRPTGVVVN